MEYEIIFGGDGKTVHVASILYDLWSDYLHFRREAESLAPGSDALSYKRLTRASINAFFNYFDGVLNQWIARIKPDFKLEGASLSAKLHIVREKVNTGRPLPRLDLDQSRSLRNKICHLKLSDSDYDIVEELLSGKFFSDADHLVNWLRIASKRLGMEPHPDIPRILRDLIAALGSESQDSPNSHSETWPWPDATRRRSSPAPS